MNQNASPQQIQKAFQLCDILGINDFQLATSILAQMNWDLEKAIQMMGDVGAKPINQNKPKPKQQHKNTAPPHNYQNQHQMHTYDHETNQDEAYQYQYNFEQFQKQNELQKKKQNFDQAYEQLNLDRTTTEVPTKIQKRFSQGRKIIEDFANYRHSYQAQLQEDSNKIVKKILSDKPRQLHKFQQSKIKNEQNRKFIQYLDNKYKCRINFTFGTFLLNLVRSYLDKKHLLVYIHKLQFEQSESVKRFLTQKQIAKFINTNCVAYGMFDNSDDYQTIQKYIPMKDLPAFALFKYNKSQKCQRFISTYSILQKQPENFMEWIAANTGIYIQKKESKIKEGQAKKQQKKQGKKQEKHPIKNVGYSHSDIMKIQNQEYQQMERVYKLRRQQSKLKKQQVEHAEQAILKKRQKFEKQPKFEQGKTIQIKFRLPQSGKSLVRIFDLKNKVIQMFEYIDCFGRDQFEQRYAKFDLTQTFPKLSLLDKKEEQIQKIFEGSNHQNIIVKEV